MITMIKAQRWALFAYLFFCAWAYNSVGVPMREWQEMFFRFATMGLVAMFIGNVWMMLFLWLNIILFILNNGTVGSSYIYNIFMAMVLFKVARTYFTSFRSRDDLKPVLGVLALSLAFMGLQLLGIDPLHTASDPAGNVTGIRLHDPIGLFGIKAVNGIFMAIVAPIVASFSVPLALLLIIPIWVCQSSVATLAYVVSILFYLFWTAKGFGYLWISIQMRLARPFFTITPYIKRLTYFKVLVPILVLGALAFMVIDRNTAPDMFKARFGIWHATFKYALARPIGWGPDSFRNLTPHKGFVFSGDEDMRSGIAVIDSEIQAPDGSIVEQYKFKYYSMDGASHDFTTPKGNPNFWDHSHNEYLNLFFEYGFFGLVLLFFFMRDLVLRFIRSVKDEETVMLASCLIAFFVASLTHFPFHLARVGYLFPILLGAYFAVTDRNATRN